MRICLRFLCRQYPFDAEGQPVRLVTAMVRVLPEDHHAHLGQRRQVEGGEDGLLGGAGGKTVFLPRSSETARASSAK